MQFKIDESLGPKRINDLFANDNINNFEEGTAGQSLATVEIDYTKIQDLANQIKVEAADEKEGFEEVKHSEAYFEKAKEDYRIQQNIAQYDDIGEDSVYPLMTSDPKKAREFNVKINQDHLNRVMTKDEKGDGKSIVQSVLIEDYIPVKRN